MKTIRFALPLFTILLFAAQSFAVGPFGFEKGMKRSEVIRLWGEGSATPPDHPDTVFLLTAPNPHPSFKAYILIFSPQDGLLKVGALEKAMHVDLYGTELRQAFNDVVEGLSHKYGSPEVVDTYQNNRVLDGFWSLAKHVDHVTSIHLTAKELSAEKGVVSLEFEFEGFEEYEKNRKSNEDKSY
jgi:hypothetical protein